MRKTVAFSLALLGLFISIYLLWVYASPSHPMVCLGGGCDEVRASSYARFLGIPTPAFGVAFYALLAMLMFAEATGKRGLHRVIVALAAIGFLVAAALTGVEAFVLHAWCSWCVGQALAVTLILVVYLMGRPRDAREPSVAGRYWTVLMVAVMVGSLAFYMLQRAEQSLAQAPPPPPAEAIAARLIRPESHVAGNPQSTVTFVEFGDLQCPACAASYPIVRSLKQQYGDRVKFAFRHFPLANIHQFAMKAAVASECAAQQGKFWEYIDRAYDAKGDLKDESLERYAAELSLDKQSFHQCLSTDATLPQVQRDQADGLALGVRPTPTFFVGKRRIEGALTEQQFSTMLAEDLQSAAQVPEIPAAPAPAASTPPAPEKTAARKPSQAVPGTPLSMSGGASTGGFLNVKGASTDCSPDAPKGPEPPLIHTADAQKKLQQGAVFVDVRSADDFAKAHIKGARSVPLLEVERRALELPKDKQIVVYEAGTAPGDVCAAAKSSARVLISLGFQAVVYQDGLKDWEKAGGAVEK